MINKPKPKGYLRVKSDSTGDEYQVAVYHGNPVDTRAFGDADVTVDIWYVLPDERLLETSDYGQTFKVGDTGETFSKVRK